MSMRAPRIGLRLLCLMILSACQQAPLAPAPQITSDPYPIVQRCMMPAMSPHTNGELQEALTTAKGAWAECAARVDAIVDAQQHVKDRSTLQIGEDKTRAHHD